MRRPSTSFTCPGSNGSIMPCSSAMRRIQRSDLMVMGASGCGEGGKISSAGPATHAKVWRRPCPPVRAGRPITVTRRPGRVRMHPARLALACCVLLPLLPPPAAAMDGGPWQVVRIQATDPGLRQQLGDLFGHIAFDEAGGMARVDTDAGARAQLRRLGIGWEVDLEASRALNAFVAGGVHGLRSIPGYACYRTVEETFASIDAMVAQYPTLASLVDIGVSW